MAQRKIRLENKASSCEEALGAISLGEECSESFVQYPSLPADVGVEPNLSTSWVQISNSHENSDLNYSQNNESFTIISNGGNSVSSHCLNSDNFISFGDRQTKGNDKPTTSSEKHVKSETDLINRVNSAKKVKFPRVKLNKVFRSHSQPQQYLVKSGGGMGVAVPELCIDNQYFCEPSTSTDCETDFHQADASQQSKDTKRENKSNKSSMSSSSLHKRLQPSQTLALSASALRDYFTSSSEKSKSIEKETESEETVKSKVIDLWNNMRYSSWPINFKTNFSKETPITMLGKVYHYGFSDCPSLKSGDIDQFKKDFYSLTWFTYRRRFAVISGTGITSDCGWGCMIRCGQMMMACALTRHILPVAWTWQPQDWNTSSKNHKRILSWFEDVPSNECPFSLHNLVKAGNSMNKEAGNWYGPTTVVHMFRECLLKASQTSTELNNLNIYVAQDGGVYIQDILDICSTNKCYCNKESLTDIETDDWEMPSHNDSFKYYNSVNSKSKIRLVNNNRNSREDLVCDSASKKRDSREQLNLSSFRSSLSEERSMGEWDLLSFPIKATDSTQNSSQCTCNGWKSVIIFIPVRMGGSELNMIYNACIYSLLMDDQCIGIIGGKPKHALYFVGFQDEELIYLDPHISQDYVALESVEDLESYHCTSPRKLHISKMDPSATFGFYCKTREDFYNLIERIPKLATAKDGNLESPLFEFLDGSSNNLCTSPSTSFRCSTSRPVANISQHVSSNDSEEFVIE